MNAARTLGLIRKTTTTQQPHIIATSATNSSCNNNNTISEKPIAFAFHFIWKMFVYGGYPLSVLHMRVCEHLYSIYLLFTNANTAGNVLEISLEKCFILRSKCASLYASFTFFLSSHSDVWLLLLCCPRCTQCMWWNTVRKRNSMFFFPIPLIGYNAR